eukprot:jgi/Chrpa1/21926/Chrysochromulina_OHIO_Genome00010886-RA
MVDTHRVHTRGRETARDDLARISDDHRHVGRAFEERACKDVEAAIDSELDGNELRRGRLFCLHADPLAGAGADLEYQALRRRRQPVQMAVTVKATRQYRLESRPRKPSMARAGSESEGIPQIVGQSTADGIGAVAVGAAMRTARAAAAATTTTITVAVVVVIAVSMPFKTSMRRPRRIHK